MSEKELSRYYKIRQEIDDLENRIKEFGDGVSGIAIKDIITMSSGKHESLQEKLILLKDKWVEKRISALEEYLKIENYIDNVDDPETRTIMRLRFLDLLTWEEIGEVVHMERTSVSKKIRKYIKVQNAK